MPSKYPSINVGDTLRSLTVLVEADRVGKHRRWVVECKCGKRFTMYQHHLKVATSCGCENSPTFTKETQERFRLVREFLRKNPKFSTCGLARMLHCDYPELYPTTGSANSVVRQIRGANGNANNKDKEFRR